MKCTNCGSEIEDGMKFCTSCGTPLNANQAAPAMSQPETAPDALQPKTTPVIPQQPAQPQIPEQVAQAFATPSPLPADAQPADATQQKKSRAVPIAIAVVVIILVIAAALVFFFMQDDKKDLSSSGTVTSNVQATTPTFENDWIRITLPANIADKVSFTQSDDGYYIFIRSVQGDKFLATIVLAEERKENESAHATYSLGATTASNFSDTVIMELSYLDANNDTIYWGYIKSAPRPIELGITKLLGMTPEQFADCIEIKGASGYKPSELEALGGDVISDEAESPQNASTGVPTGAFWGIWAQASKDKAEMEAAAQRMKNEYGFDAFVVLTTDWSNLNSEPWYCVSLGSYATQDAANAALSKARSAYSDAYVKYSGNKK